MKNTVSIKTSLDVHGIEIMGPFKNVTGDLYGQKLKIGIRYKDNEDNNESKKRGGNGGEKCKKKQNATSFFDPP